MPGRRVFTREVLPSSVVQSYLMDQTVMRFPTANARAADLPAPQEGQVTYLEDVNRGEWYDGAGWQYLFGDNAPAWAAWVPTLASTGAGFAQGVKTGWSGTYHRNGRKITAQFTIPLASGFAQGSSGTFELTPPVPAAALDASAGTAGGIVVGHAWLWSSTTAVAVARLKANGRIEFLHHGSAGGAIAGVGAPWAWASPNIINGIVTYQAAS